MPLWQKYLKKLSTIIPVGAVGAVMLLGSALPTDASEGPPSALYPGLDGGVSERLAAIRYAASVAIEPKDGVKRTDPNIQLAWGNLWNNFGWRGRPGWQRGGWNNFRPRWNNWRNAWRNW